MIERALDKNNDLILLSGSFATVSGSAQVAQHVRTRLQFYLGEWFADRRIGTPWFQEIFVKPFNPVNVENILKSRISQTPGLKEITEFKLSGFDDRTRKLQIEFSALTDDGPINEEGFYLNV